MNFELKYKNLYLKKNWFENVFCKMAAIFSDPNMI